MHKTKAKNPKYKNPTYGFN